MCSPVFVRLRWSGSSSRWWRGGSRGITSRPRPVPCPAPPTAVRPRATSSITMPSGAVCGTLWVRLLHIRESPFSFACLQQYNEIKQMSHMLTIIPGCFESSLICSSQRIERCCWPAFTQGAGQRCRRLLRDPDLCRFSEGFVCVCVGIVFCFFYCMFWPLGLKEVV